MTQGPLYESATRPQIYRCVLPCLVFREFGCVCPAVSSETNYLVFFIPVVKFSFVEKNCGGKALFVIIFTLSQLLGTLKRVWARQEQGEYLESSDPRIFSITSISCCSDFLTFNISGIILDSVTVCSVQCAVCSVAWGWMILSVWDAVSDTERGDWRCLCGASDCGEERWGYGEEKLCKCRYGEKGSRHRQSLIWDMGRRSYVSVNMGIKEVDTVNLWDGDMGRISCASVDMGIKEVDTVNHWYRRGGEEKLFKCRYWDKKEVESQSLRWGYGEEKLCKCRYGDKGSRHCQSLRWGYGEEKLCKCRYGDKGSRHCQLFRWGYGEEKLCKCRYGDKGSRHRQ